MLSVCGTPIGNLGDVTSRVLEALREADLIAAEDTRHTRKLLSHFDIHVPMTSLFKHNEAQKTEEVLRRLRDGDRVALVSDAGMPGISDPGMRLVARAVAEGLEVRVLPGPSAVTTAVVAAGMEAEAAGFRFVGYLPRRARDLEADLQAWRRCGGLVVAFETAPRLATSLKVLAAAAPQAPAAVCRELTKLHEEVARGSLVELSERFGAVRADGAAALRGEIAVVVDLGAALDEAAAALPPAAAAARELLGRGLSRRDTAAALQVCLGLPHREAEELARRTAAEG
jgi:16S rRNA (cytidine1402-2'-O)-methyltransferase